MADVKPHAICVPYPAQGNINPMLKLAKILHHRGFCITFVNTEFNHEKLLKSGGPRALIRLPSFRFETIPNGLPMDRDPAQDINEPMSRTCAASFKTLLERLNDVTSSSAMAAPPVSCTVSDGIMTFAIEAAEELGLPQVLFCTASACGFMGYMQCPQLPEKRLTPLKDESYITNGYLDQTLDWIPGMKGLRLRDLPTFLRTTNPDEFLIKILLQETASAKKASAVVINTYDEIEHEAIQALQPFLPPIYPIGPLRFLEETFNDKSLAQLGLSFWKEEPECLEWLHTKEPSSVLYVNFGSITVMTRDQMVEFAWGLANSELTFLWIIRPDLVSGDSSVLPRDFLEETESRRMLTSWCPQEQVLQHPSIGGFLTHNGWNSTMESICYGVPMICWPFFADQMTNCWYCCTHWGIGMGIDSNVKRDVVKSLVTELMVGEKGREMKKKALEWKSKAKSPNGSSSSNFEKMIKLLLHSKRYNFLLHNFTNSCVWHNFLAVLLISTPYFNVW